MSRRLQRLRFLLGLAEKNCQSAEQQLHQGLSECQRMREQAAQLRRMRSQYPPLEGTINVTQLHRQRFFVQRIDDAVVAQMLQIERAEKALEPLREVWQAARGREKALRKVCANLADKQARKVLLMEERALDDRAVLQRLISTRK